VDKFEKKRRDWESERATRIRDGEKALSKYPGLTESLNNWCKEGAPDFHPLTFSEIIQILAEDKAAREAVKLSAGIDRSHWSDDPETPKALNSKIAWGLVDYLAK